MRANKLTYEEKKERKRLYDIEYYKKNADKIKEREKIGIRQKKLNMIKSIEKKIDIKLFNIEKKTKKS